MQYKKILSITILSGMLFFGCSRPPITSLVQDALREANIGDDANWQAASGHIEAVIRRGKNQVNVVSLYLLCLFHLHRQEQALKVSQEALELYPDNFFLHYITGKIHHDIKHYSRALYHLKKCYAMRPDHTDTIILMMKINDSLGRKESPDFYKKLLERKVFVNSYLMYNALAVSYIHQKKFPLAISTFSKALVLSDGHPMIYLNMAVLFDFYIQRPVFAKRFYQKYLEKANGKFPIQEEKIALRLRQSTNVPSTPAEVGSSPK